MDSVDRGLVHALQLDGRAPFSQIAEVLGASEQTVARRYRKLRSTGAIRVVGGVDGARLGYTSWTIRLRTTPDASDALGAARAGVPLGATTYYFTSLDDLSRAALAYAARSANEGLRAGDGDIAGTVAALTEEYLADRGRALTETELYLAAVRRPELRPLARTWFDGLVGLLSEYADPAAAKAAVFLIDGALLRALSDQQPLDTAGLATALRAVLRPTP